MQAEFERWITGFANRAVYEEGLKLFLAGGVLEVRRPNAKIAQCLVANAGGRFERSQISFVKNVVAPSCSCGQPRGWCVHSMAALLAFMQQEAGAPDGWDGSWPDGAAVAAALKPVPPPAAKKVRGGVGMVKDARL